MAEAARLMGTSQFLTVPLDETHNVAAFNCTRSLGIQGFLRNDASAYVRKGVSTVFVIPAEDDPTRVLGYYTLSAYVIQREGMSDSTRKKLPLKDVPFALIGHMGRDDDAPFAKGAMAPLLVVDAAQRVAEVLKTIAVWGLCLHAANEHLAKKVYTPLGFKAIRDEPKLMYSLLGAFL